MLLLTAEEVVSSSQGPWGLSYLPGLSGKPASFPRLLLTWKCCFPVQMC